MPPARNPVLAGDQRDDCLLTLRHNPIGLLLSASLWRSAGYLVGYQLVSGVLFAIAVTTVSVVIAFSFTIIAVPLMLAAAARVIRGCADVERNRLRPVLAGPGDGCYPPAAGPGSWRQALARWTDGTTWRELAYLVGLMPILTIADTLVLSVWGALAAGITLPLWYSHATGVCIGTCAAPNAPGVMIGYFPHGPHGAGAHGFYGDSLQSALLVAAACAVLFLLMNYVLVAAARLQAKTARAVLGPPSDPLAPARAVLAGPRPLGPLIR
jgi:uncharacterized membrane protein